MRRYILSLLAIFMISGVALGQATGFPPFGSFERGEFDSTNLEDLNSIIAIPIVQSPGRGMNFDFSVIYNSLIWTKSGNAWVLNPNLPPLGWSTTYSVGSTHFTTSTSRMRCNKCTLGEGCLYIDKTTQQNYTYIDPVGTVHSFPGVYWEDDYSECDGSDTFSGTFTGHASDASGYFITLGSSDGSVQSVINKSGDTIFGGVADTNGNYISATSPQQGETDWIDTAGHTAVKIIVSGSTTKYEYYDTTGTLQTITLNLQSLNIKTNFACSGVVEYTGSANVPQSIVLPNGQSYTFTYEPTPGNSGYYTGRVQKMVLPNGGYIQYTYGGSNDGVECGVGTIVNLTRIVNDGTNSYTFQYARALNGSNWATTETMPQMPYDSAANQTVYTYGSTWSEQIYQGSSTSGTLLATINTTWTSNGTPATRTIILGNNQQSERATAYDSNGLLDQLKEYDWGSGAPGALLRTTTYTYLSTSAYTNLNIIDRVTEKTIADASGTIHYREDTSYDGTTISPCPTGIVQHNDTSYGCSFTTRGNPTSATVYTNAAAPSGGITKNRYYDMFGNLVQADVDCCQSKKWNFSSATNYAYPDSVVSGATGGPQVTTSFTYNAYTGQKATETDPNNQQTSYSYDSMHRPLTITRPDGAQISYAYNDSAHTIAITNPVDSSHAYIKTEYQDGLGRLIKGTVSNSSGTVYSNTQLQYDPVGRKYQQSDPYTSSAQYWKTTQYDAYGRPTKTILQDNSTATYSYSGPTVTTTDPAGHQKETQTDGIGRLVSFYEPDPSNNNSLTLQTTRTYTVLNGLATITQGSQTRTNNYDDAGRLTSEVHPESGTTSYQYNNFDKRTQRTDNRGVITTYGYDTLNRLHQVSYNVGSTGVPATPTVTYAYGTTPSQNNNGRLLTLTDGTGSTTYSYDVLGRKTQEAHVISGNNYTVGYQYNEEGDITSLTYPSGRVVQHGYDSIGRLASIASGTTTYLSGTEYNADFQPTTFGLGNGVVANFSYSADREQLTATNYVKSGTTLFGQSYTIGTAGANDNEITGITDNVDSGRNMAYTYDALNRLTSAVSNGSTNYPKWGLSFSYDRYGNRLSQTVTAGTAPANSVSVNAATNHISTAGYSYDANGNTTNDGANTLIYDAENRAVSSADGAGTATYSYDGTGLRVQKAFSGTTTVYIFSGNKVLDEYANGTLSEEYIYRNTALFVEYAGSTLLYHGHDQVSDRLNMDGNGNVVGSQGHFPFGEDWYMSNTTMKWHFTTYERDAESSNDYAKFRYHVNRLGRFASTDPVCPRKTNPQMQNRYSYVWNDPIDHRDVDGRDPFFCDPTFDVCECDPFFGCSCEGPDCGGGDGGGGGGGGFGGGGCDRACELAQCLDFCVGDFSVCVDVASEIFDSCVGECYALPPLLRAPCIAGCEQIYVIRLGKCVVQLTYCTIGCLLTYG
ncbi:MAG TPA: RHS repeat-associated core domain-containing protein [Candidatus Acidoferrales bacterium]|nr:RHS repeat-associated core domain-containing protein [Candidatus Acidoferrales bacterium]